MSTEEAVASALPFSWCARRRLLRLRLLPQPVARRPLTQVVARGRVPQVAAQAARAARAATAGCGQAVRRVRGAGPQQGRVSRRPRAAVHAVRRFGIPRRCRPGRPARRRGSGPGWSRPSVWQSPWLAELPTLPRARVHCGLRLGTPHAVRRATRSSWLTRCCR